jgi:hypothetical protein
VLIKVTRVGDIHCRQDNGNSVTVSEYFSLLWGASWKRWISRHWLKAVCSGLGRHNNFRSKKAKPRDFKANQSKQWQKYSSCVTRARDYTEHEQPN